MEIIVGKNAGFCGGVEFAVRNAENLLDEGTIYCLGELVHNEQVVKNLEDKGMITVNSIEDIPNNSRVIFRAHGEPIVTYKIAEEKGLVINDLTCGFVKSIHKKVENAKKDSFIIIIGTKKHPETIGTKGFSGPNSYVVESEDDILDSYMEYEKTNLGKVFVVGQTTFSSQKFDELAFEIQENFCEADIIIDKTICNTTETRQQETVKIAQKCDKMLIIGGQNSSNTRKLYEISKQNCDNVYYIQTIDDAKNIQFNENDVIGIMAGASTPKYIIQNIKEYVEGK